MACVDVPFESDGVPLEESNCALIGSDEDKAARHAAALYEPAWNVAGKEPGVQVWRIENFQVVPWPQHGKQQVSLHTGDSYIFLETVPGVSDFKAFQYHIFFWLGEESSLDEEGTAAYKTVELDAYFDGKASQSRETQYNESTAFRKLFPHITYLDGGVASGFKQVVKDSIIVRLYQVRKTKQGIVQKEVRLARESLNVGDCFVLDAGDVIYVFHGEESHPLEKYESNIAAEKLEAKRLGRAKATHLLDSRFWDLLGGEGPIKSASEGDDRIPVVDIGEGILFKVCSVGGKLQLEETAREDLRTAMLDSFRVMLVDNLAEIMIWIGQKSSEEERKNAYRCAFTYLQSNERSRATPIHMFKEGTEIRNALWNKIFSD